MRGCYGVCVATRGLRAAATLKVHIQVVRLLWLEWGCPIFLELRAGEVKRLDYNTKWLIFLLWKSVKDFAIYFVNEGRLRPIAAIFLCCFGPAFILCYISSY